MAKSGAAQPSLGDVIERVRQAARIDRSSPAFAGTKWKPIVGDVEKLARQGPLPTELVGCLRAWHAAASPRELTPKEQAALAIAQRTIAYPDGVPWDQVRAALDVHDRCKRITSALKDERKLLERLEKLLHASGVVVAGAATADDQPIIPVTDAVGAAVAADRAAGGAAAGAAWDALLRHALALSSTAPSNAWTAKARDLVAAIDPASYRERLAAWFAQAGKPAPVQRLGAFRQPVDPTLLNDESADLLKGLAWSVPAAGDAGAALAPALGALAEACFRKVANVGPRCPRVANAAVAALAALAKPEAAAQLSVVRSKARHLSSRARVDKSLDALADKTGMSSEELAEVGVPTFQIDLDAAMRDRSILGKDAARVLAAQAVRIERLFMTPERTWPIDIWRQRYLDHPLVGLLARRLIWKVGDTLAAWKEGDQLLDAQDRSVSPSRDATVQLWHPTSSDQTEVLAWRRWLDRHQVAQPFKQAHREVYILTDAERDTHTYSNRFAAHILRQHQLTALAQHRGWEYRLQGQFDSANHPTLRLPAHRLTAEFWVEPIEGEVSQAGIFSYVTTDQVRFGQPLEQVPPVVFSEVMRDVDLFVGVASVGNDPTWQDGGPGGAYRDYWEHYSFGPLSQTAVTRRQVLQAIVPRLKIAPRCTLTEKFLVVRGDLRTYKIHLGSGNILMEPNDQYLCVVPDHRRSHASGVFLPFEGDTTLSIILSKAFLLATDKSITDPTITRQIAK